jgi:hypothetical protein
LVGSLQEKAGGVFVATPLTIKFPDVGMDPSLLDADALRINATVVTLKAQYEDLLTATIFPSPRSEYGYNGKELLKFEKVLRSSDSHTLLSIIWQESGFISSESLSASGLDRSCGERLNSWKLATQLAKSPNGVAKLNSRIRTIGLAGQAYNLVERNDNIHANTVVLQGTEALHRFMLTLVGQYRIQINELVTFLSRLGPELHPPRQ